MCTPCARSVVHNQPKVEAAPCPLKDDWTDTAWSIHAAGITQSATGRTWTNLEAIMLSETSQSQKDTHRVTPLPRAVPFIEMERTVGARGMGVVV